MSTYQRRLPSHPIENNKSSLSFLFPYSALIFFLAVIVASWFGAHWLIYSPSLPLESEHFIAPVPTTVPGTQHMPLNVFEWQN